jgi:2-polyprenyl-6-methoxyphenol hydroxylase-like FAD-dependent oxidoreductase
MDMSNVAIIGAGISGLTLALRLQQLGVDTTLYTPDDADAIRAGRLPNTVARFEPTVARERELGVDHWSDVPGYSMECIHAAVPGVLSFRGDMDGYVRAVDFRVYLSTLLEDYAARGGRVAVGPTPSVDDLARLSSGHDLVVAAVGRSSIAQLFTRDPERSPYDAPQRVLCAGLYEGVDYPDPVGLSFNIVPGVGEIFQMPMLSERGLVSTLLFEGVPAGPLEQLTQTRYDDDPGAFNALVRSLLEQFAPAIAERVTDSFGLLGPQDVLQGAITPTVRNAWAQIAGGFAIAVGDAWITNDPITGQGANLGSRSAWTLADAIAAGGPFDEAFCRRVADDMWRDAAPVTMWTNAFLQPPPPHALALLGAAAQHQAVADGFVQMFANPPQMWATISDPAATEAYIAERAAPAGAAIA